VVGALGVAVRGFGRVAPGADVDPTAILGGLGGAGRGGVTDVDQEGVATQAKLTNRELQVLIGIAAGWTNRELAEKMFLSVRTIDTYRTRLLGKLELRNNSDLTRFAIQRGLLQM